MIYMLLVAVCVVVLIIILTSVDEYSDKSTVLFGIISATVGVIFMVLVANDFRIERNQLTALAYDNNITLPEKYDEYIEELLVERYRNTLNN